MLMSLGPRESLLVAKALGVEVDMFSVGKLNMKSCFQREEMDAEDHRSCWRMRSSVVMESCRKLRLK